MLTGYITPAEERKQNERRRSFELRMQEDFSYEILTYATSGARAGDADAVALHQILCELDPSLARKRSSWDNLWDDPE